MGFNEIPDLEANETVNKVVQYFNTSVSNFTNQSDSRKIKLFDLNEAYKLHEKEQLLVYKYVAFIIGTLIIMSNLIVVISSGLILKKGQQPKSTYLLLGNVSLADTIIGISIIVGTSVGQTENTNPLCIFQIGMLVCPAMVSIFSVGFIAVDRYIYILHGLYYQRWFNTTKVRIAIVCIWVIGTTLSFVPVTGWRNQELDVITRCDYVSLFPAPVIMFNTVLSIIPILLVAVLYSIILVKALKNVKKIQASESSTNNLKATDVEKAGLRIFRGRSKSKAKMDVNKIDNTQSIKPPEPASEGQLKRSASFDGNFDIRPSHQTTSVKFNSIDHLNTTNGKNNDNITESDAKTDTETFKNTSSESEISIYTIQSRTEPSDSMESVKAPHKGCQHKCCWRKTPENKPNKWRAITVVMLTSGSFIVTWLPFFIVVIFFILCEDKKHNPRCFNLLSRFGAPLTTLAFFNSILNPLIYAWWHKGFQKSVRAYYCKFFRKRCNSRHS